jgi:hypothetical protein
MAQYIPAQVTQFFEISRVRTIVRNSAIILVGCAIAIAQGKDLNADLLNYHVYAAHAFLTGQFKVDFMGAGLQGYLNPLGYLPFYWMLKAGWHSLLIGIVLAVFHGLNLVMLWEISEKFLFAGYPRAQRLTFIAVALGAASPVFLGTIGGTFLDPALSVLILGGLLLLCTGIDSARPHWAYWFVAGALMGSAVGLKLTNVIFPAAAGAFLLIIQNRTERRGFAFAIFSLGTIVGLTVTGGWWAYELYRDYGNPFFPFFNGYFQSPDFPAVNLDHDRFKLAGIADALTLPFRMAQMHSWVYVEIMAPDIRFALLVIVSVLLAVKQVSSRWRSHQVMDRDPSKALFFTIGFVCVSSVLWLITSGNGRYVMPLLLLVGPLLCLGILKLLPNGRQAISVGAFLLFLQIVHAGNAGFPRWDSGPWTDKWIDVSVPSELLDGPYGYLTLGPLNNSFVAPFLSPGSGFVNLTGGFPISPTGPGSARVNGFIKVYAGRLRMLIRSQGSLSKDVVVLDVADEQLAPWGLRVVRPACSSIEITLTPNDRVSRVDLKQPARSFSLLSCAVERGAKMNEESQKARKRFTAVFDSVDKSCPKLFSPPGWYPLKLGNAWFRRYMNTDTIVFVKQGRVFYSRYDYGPFDVDMGSVEDWENGTSTFKCEKPARPW